MNRLALCAAVIAVPLLAARGIAQPASAPSAASSAAGPGADPVALGATLANQGANGVAPCASCHGAQGEGNAAAGFPRLVGQSAEYLQHQLDAYASDIRSNAVMQPIAKAMNPAQRRAAAAYYEAQLQRVAAAASAPGSTAAAGAALGKSIATVGIEGRNVQACANCHGPDGVGEWATYPALAGQHASYLANALAEWKSGARRTDPSGQMPRIARLLSDAEAKAVVAYYAALPPPTAPQATTLAKNGKPHVTIVSGPTRSGQGAPAQGVGTEQGAPLAGGTQGVGSAGNPTGPQSGAPGGNTASAPPARAASATR